MKPKVKICGLTRPGDAALAVEQGAWALGVIFAPESPRCLDLARAAEVLAPAPEAVERVGVFVNASVNEIEAAVAGCGLTVVQLHGEEDNGLCLQVGRRTGCAVIKALRVAGPGSLEHVVRFDTDFILLDTYRSGSRGGTGETFDWELAALLPAEVRSSRIILSGGLTPGNLSEAITVVEPMAVDVSSGIEATPGMKSREKMELLFKAIGRD
ncbi:N-(5'-phosphoribosyl)anthranilate isomerase [bacterium BMS3Abin01]|nr:N-(5'-phosphoribosyl)anthranilate isomerase [bacterium BMS3Abin01]